MRLHKSSPGLTWRTAFQVKYIAFEAPAMSFFSKTKRVVTGLEILRLQPSVAGFGVGRPNLEDHGNCEIPNPPQPLQINLFEELCPFSRRDLP